MITTLLCIASAGQMQAQEQPKAQSFTTNGLTYANYGNDFLYCSRATEYYCDKDEITNFLKRNLSPEYSFEDFTYTVEKGTRFYHNHENSKLIDFITTIYGSVNVYLGGKTEWVTKK